MRKSHKSYVEQPVTKDLKDLIEPEKNLENRQTVIQGLFDQTEESAKAAQSAKFLAFENEKILLLGGNSITRKEIKEDHQQLVTYSEQKRDPRFSELFLGLAKINNWSDEVRKTYRKPRIAADTINEVIYNRFPAGVLSHIHELNRYVKYCVRKSKNYKFLSDEGIILLEIYLNDAVLLMNSCQDNNEFREMHSKLYGTKYQLKITFTKNIDIN